MENPTPLYSIESDMYNIYKYYIYILTIYIYIYIIKDYFALMEEEEEEEINVLPPRKSKRPTRGKYIYCVYIYLNYIIIIYIIQQPLEPEKYKDFKTDEKNDGKIFFFI